MRCYLRKEGVPSVENESSVDVLKLENVPCKSIIVRFSTFRHRALFYRNRSKLKNAEVRPDLTKNRYKIFTDAIDFVKAYRNVDYVMVHINCRVKMFFKNGRSSKI